MDAVENLLTFLRMAFLIGLMFFFRDISDIRFWKSLKVSLFCSVGNQVWRLRGVPRWSLRFCLLLCSCLADCSLVPEKGSQKYEKKEDDPALCSIAFNMKFSMLFCLCTQHHLSETLGFESSNSHTSYWWFWKQNLTHQMQINNNLCPFVKNEIRKLKW